jgi:hypothetical protein
MKEIICKNGEIALCDDEDYPLLSRFIWYMGSELKSGGYPCCFIYGQHNTRKQIFMHQLVMPSAVFVDHEDRNKMNNQKENLRPATWQENQWNKGKARSCRFGKPTSQYKGVSFRPLRGKDRWLAMIKHVELGKHKSTGKMIYIGYYDTEIEAAKAYNEKVLELRGEWAWVNPLPQSGLL